MKTVAEGLRFGFERLKTQVLSALLAGLASVAPAEVKPGENIVLNPDFLARPGEPPQYWKVGKCGDVVTAANLLEPGASPCVTLTGVPGNRGVDLRQTGMRLMAGGRYRISAKVRAEGLSVGGQIEAANDHWRWSEGVRIPEGTYDWKPISSEFIAKETVGGPYFAVIHMKPFAGKLQIAHVKIEALDEETARHTSPSDLARVVTIPRLVPWAPLLDEIPSDKPELQLHFFGQLPEGTVDDYDVVATGGNGTSAVSPLAADITTVRLPDPQPEGRVSIRLVRRSSGASVFARAYDYALKSKVEAPTPARRMNNLTVEYYHEPVRVDETVERRLVLARNGWVMIRAAAERVTVDGKPVITPETPRHETFRELTYGEHVIRVEGAKGGDLIVRGIPELFNYCIAPSVVKENPPFDWEFAEKYVLPGVTTLNGGRIGEDRVRGLKDRGYIWLANMSSSRLQTDDEILSRLAASKINRDCFDGVTCDEQYTSQPDVISRYADGLWRYAHPQGKRVYSWVIGAPNSVGVDHDLTSVSVNATRGKGRLLAELYAKTCPTEAEARDYVRDWFGRTFGQFDLFSPVYRPHCGIILGNYCQMPRISLWGNVEVDFRYYLDLQFNMIANDPTFAGLGCAGVWGSYYAEEEVHRWTFMLMRHYFIEGHREMLSPKYGFRYISGHLANGDFSEGLTGWTATGRVTTGRREGLGWYSEGRRSQPEGAGDTFAVLTRETNAVASVTQVVRGLVPGREYCLRYAVLNAEDVAAYRRGKMRRYALKAVLPDGVRVNRAMSWAHDDDREKTKGPSPAPRANVRHVVFTANASELPIVFTTAAAKPGASFALNAVSVHPYLPPLGGLR